jgi:four helix bundle protein
MATIEKFEDIIAWQKGRELTRQIYRHSRQPEFARDFALKDQIRRAAISITSNIAEGFERGGNQEFLQFLSISRGSCGAVRSQLYVALDENYVTESEFRDLYDLSQEVGRTLDGFMSYLRTSNIRGRKYQDE